MHVPYRSAALAALSLFLVACTREQDGSPAPARVAAAPVAPSTPSTPAGNIDPCALLDSQVVDRALLGVGAPKRDRADDTYGIQTCIWGSGPSAVVLQSFDVPAGAAETEIRSRSFALVDPKSPQAPTAVRLEAFPGVGDAAIAFVERVDAGRGTRSAGASVIVQVGFRAVVVRAPELARLDREEALDRLRMIAEDVARRLAP